MSTAGSDIKYGPHREESTAPKVGVCQKCGVNRFEAPCPNGHMAASMGQCPMVGSGAPVDREATK